MLFCPGAATGRHLGFGTHLLGGLGIRLISADRPGLGASDPDPGRDLLGFATDVAEMFRLRDITGVRGVGFSQGAPFLLACAATGVLTAAAVVAGTDELAHPSFAAALPADVTAMVEAVRTDPAGAETFFAGYGDPDAFWQRILDMSGAADRAVYTDPVFEAAYRHAMSDALAPGPAGYARDTVLASARWPFDLARVRVPVHLWYGAADTSPVHSPDLGATLATRLPDAERHLPPGAGGALLWTHTTDILRTLLASAQG
ncbi:alpha/beta fold hydrolase [Actinoplanes sp. DH11]|uniref:alpha/beta fold hydrolase n=1 Tax=Actinoplanes sp. DH11 TaxID=2857011 RepID=UPI001E324CF9|nr:alpha/beta hydrolase [Actinoplanes sp. DH11]